MTRELPRIKTNSQQFINFYVLFTLLVYNGSFFEKLQAIDNNLLFMLCGTIIIYGVLNIILNLLFVTERVTKILAISLVIGNAFAYYFMSSYNILIDKVMILNVIRTNIYEASDLFQWKLPFIILGLGIIPALVISRCTITFQPWKQELKLRLKQSGIIAVIIGLIIGISPQRFKDIANNHYELRYALVPSNYIGSIIGVGKMHKELTRPYQAIATDAYVEKYWHNDKKNLFVFVVGETARAANFSLGNYQRDTNAALKDYKDELIYYPQFYACGTSTAVAVPCMFSKDGRQDFVTGSELNQGNLTDVMQNNGYHSLWRDNNTGCQDNCNRIEYEKACMGKNCLDNVLLKGLEDKLKKINQNTFLVLHQRGSHGPDYFNRYPQDREAPYQPICKDAGLKSCSREELLNAYDNSIHYTSEFLQQLIKLLKGFEKDYNIVMIYASDHGESLGEGGKYLHAYPYDSAPEEQKHIPALLWFPQSTAQDLRINKQCLRRQAESYHSHDNLFHSFLGLAGIKSSVYKEELDIFAPCQTRKD